MSYFHRTYEEEMSRVTKTVSGPSSDGIQLCMSEMKYPDNKKRDYIVNEEMDVFIHDFAYSDPGCNYYDFEEVNYVDILRRSKSADFMYC